MMDQNYLDEIRSALRQDSQRIGDVFRARERDPDISAQAIATELVLPTSGQISKAIGVVNTLLTCRRTAEARTTARETAGTIRNFITRHTNILSEGTRDRLQALEDEHQRVADGIVEDNEDGDEDGDEDDVPENGESTPETSLQRLANKLNLRVDFLEEVRTLLDDKKQIIFQGPPGTGKTYVAQELAECLASSDGHVTLVQFHPSFSYEDFVQGFRPKTIGDGLAGFELRDGPLRRAAEGARCDPNEKHFLIIDEINRGNIASVFGELYFLLEYRDRPIKLQYSDEEFALPGNLYIIGTMNTSDRSIALVDLALRRRFYFVDFYPDKDPLKGLLLKWLKRNAPNLEWVAGVVDEANKALGDRHAAIGPSYFMKAGLTRKTVERIWEHSVLPYIGERLFGEHDRLIEFGLYRLRDKVAQSNAPASDVTQNDVAANPSDGGSDATD